MAVLEINGDFSVEKAKAESRFSTAEGAIANIEGQVEVLTAAWQDEKSSEVIQALQGYVTDMKAKLQNAKNETNETFGALYDCIKIYKG